MPMGGREGENIGREGTMVLCSAVKQKCRFCFTPEGYSSNLSGKRGRGRPAHECNMWLTRPPVVGRKRRKIGRMVEVHATVPGSG